MTVAPSTFSLMVVVFFYDQVYYCRVQDADEVIDPAFTPNPVFAAIATEDIPLEQLLLAATIIARRKDIKNVVGLDN